MVYVNKNPQDPLLNDLADTESAIWHQNLEALELYRRLRFTPLIITEIYLTLSVLVFAFGPWPWGVEQPFIFYLLLFLYQMAFAYGYIFSGSQKRDLLAEKTANIAFERKLLRISIIVTVLMIIPEFTSVTGASFTSISEFGTILQESLADPGYAYNLRQLALQDLDSSIADAILYAFTSPFLWLMIPIGTKLWRVISGIERILIIVSLLLNISIWLAAGTNKGLFDTFIVLSTCLVSYAVIAPSSQRLRLFRRSRIWIAVAVVIGFIAFLSYMSFSISSRTSNISLHRSVGISVDESAWYFKMFPEMTNLFLTVSSYWSQGYYGMSLALEEDFTSTWGFGNSFFLAGIADDIGFGDAALRNGYPYKIQESTGWNLYVNWHTAYTWFASDVSFLGVIPLMFIFGFMFSRFWISVLTQGNVFALSLFTLIVMLIIYLPANNQVFTSIRTFSAFWGIFAMWIVIKYQKAPLK